ncbi:DUF481 domain-containing protein [Aliigemmobacter aestuarii]|uniref:DUF481 domain-containing protein n=1 Tax=Aliigemmobacter aestuarii TaxID=1445661 RepID=A0A4S3MLU1_9RHOB|nr:DUF481 domain-containing protein [Gemmobacter aestuarii]THD82231.1 DUF481 domain-containing protein [Gemmobacter aestuarii]
MKNARHIVGLSAALIALGTTAFAQTDLTGTEAVDDRIDDITEAVTDDLDRANDASRFAFPEFRPGLSGSASVGYTGKTGNTDSQEFSLGARIRHAQGNFVQNIGVALDFTESAGRKTKEDVFGVYDANYYFNDQVYGFVLGRVKTDGLAATAGDVQKDAFLGFGPGYRVLNTPDMAWRVQSGVGISYLEDGLGASTSETGYIASSRFFWKFNDNIFATNDTDILKSDTALRVNNDLGVNFKMTDAFSTRVSYLTEYNDSRAIRTDNKLGVSLVYGF